VTRDCTATCVLIPNVGYVVTGSCGPLERVELGVSDVLEPSAVPAEACGKFRELVLRAFGKGGTRKFEPPEEAYDWLGGIGRKPGRQGGRR
jgi:hypothetical protein